MQYQASLKWYERGESKCSLFKEGENIDYNVSTKETGEIIMTKEYNLLTEEKIWTPKLIQ